MVERRDVFSGPFTPPVESERDQELAYPDGRPADPIVDPLYARGTQAAIDQAVDPLLVDARVKVAEAIDDNPPLTKDQL